MIEGLLSPVGVVVLRAGFPTSGQKPCCCKLDSTANTLMKYHQPLTTEFEGFC